MRVHLDQPAAGMAFDPRRFIVSGWIWLAEQHPDLAGVEAWNGPTKLGETHAFFARSDVNSHLALADGACTAFEFSATHPRSGPDASFDLQLHARLRDGTLTEPVFIRRVGPLPLARDPLAMLRACLPPGALGLEIGAHTRPTRGLTPFYTDCLADFVGVAGRIDFLSDARALPLAGDTLDYLCSSHVLEHLPDPLAALHEWHRVIVPGGFLYLVVPDKRFTFDEPRAVTTPDHLLRDFARGATAATSLAHVDEFVLQTDWERLRPGTPATEKPLQQTAARADYLARIARGGAVDIHFHTFTPDSLHATLRAAGFIGGAWPRFDLAAAAERYPPDRTDGIALLLRKRGTPRPRRPIPTFTVRPATGCGPPLPLVNPITLHPITAEPPRFPGGGWPDLLPPDGATPRRPWNRRWWRLQHRWQTQLRLVFSSAAHRFPSRS